MNDMMMAVITAVLAAAYAAMLALYLRAEKFNNGLAGFKKATALKLTLSSLFCIAGILSYCFIIFNPIRSAIGPTAHLFILLGLFAALPGDYFLQYIRLDVKKYITGILCFSATQALLITALVLLNPSGTGGWVSTVIITLAILFIVLVVMKKQNWQLGAEKWILTAYTILLSFMTAKAIQSMVVSLSASSLLFAAGAVLFLVSDLFLGIWNYHSGQRRHANLNWITYFTGMFLIALSIMPAFLLPLLHFEF